MTRKKAESLIEVARHPKNRRKWALTLAIGHQSFGLVATGYPLTKGEVRWWTEQIVSALMRL